MATLKQGILGNIRGSIGNVTGRVRNGKNILSIKPGKIKSSQDSDSVLRRTKFKLSVQFSKVIYSDSHLKALWKRNAENGISPFNMITKSNYQSLEGGAFTQNSTITPANGFPLNLTSADVTANSIALSFSPLGLSHSFNLSLEKNAKLLLIYHTGNNEESEKGISIFRFIDVPAFTLQTDNPVNLTVDLAPNVASLFADYQTYILFAAMVTLDNEGKIVNYSKTVFHSSEQ